MNKFIKKAVLVLFMSGTIAPSVRAFEPTPATIACWAGLGALAGYILTDYDDSQEDAAKKVTTGAVIGAVAGFISAIANAPSRFVSFRARRVVKPVYHPAPAFRTYL